MGRPHLAPLVFGLVVGIALVVPVVAFAAFTRGTIASDISTRLQEDRETSARIAAAVVQQRLQADVGSLTRFAGRIDVTDAARARDGATLDALAGQFSSPYQFKLLGIITPQGEVLARAPTGLVDPSFARDVETLARATSPQQGWAYMRPDDRAPSRPGTAAVIVVPLDVGDERFAVYGLLDIYHFASAVGPVALPSYRSVIVIDERGAVVASAGNASIAPQYSNFGEFPANKLYSLTVPGLEQALTADTGTETTLIAGQDRLATHAVVLPGHWLLYLLDDPTVASAGERRLTDQVTEGAGVAAAVAVVLAVVLGVLVGRLRRQRTELARLAIADERLRFARDLHDLLGRGLSLIAMKSELALRLVSGNAAATKEIADVQQVARQGLRDVRQAVGGYRQPRLSTELAGARSALAAAGIECHVDQKGGDLPDQIDALFAWTVREGVTNVIRHSGARRCEITVRRAEREAQVEVTDDGVPAVSGGSGYGLLGLRERAAARGGVAEAGPLPVTGFRLHIAVPLHTA